MRFRFNKGSGNLPKQIMRGSPSSSRLWVGCLLSSDLILHWESGSLKTDGLFLAAIFQIWRGALGVLLQLSWPSLSRQGVYGIQRAAAPTYLRGAGKSMIELVEKPFLANILPLRAVFEGVVLSWYLTYLKNYWWIWQHVHVQRVPPKGTRVIIYPQKVILLPQSVNIVPKTNTIHSMSNYGWALKYMLTSWKDWQPRSGKRFWSSVSSYVFGKTVEYKIIQEISTLTGSTIPPLPSTICWGNRQTCFGTKSHRYF